MKSLINYIKSQNKYVISANTVLKIISIVPLKKNNKLYQAVVQTDIASYNKVIEYGKLFVGYDICRIFDAVEVHRCFKYYGYHYISKQCTYSIIVCSLCAQNHNVQDCPKTGILHCINCHNYNKNSTDPVSVNHVAWGRNCHVYKITLKNFRNNIISLQ